MCVVASRVTSRQLGYTITSLERSHVPLVGAFLSCLTLPGLLLRSEPVYITHSATPTTSLHFPAGERSIASFHLQLHRSYTVRRYT